MLSKRKPYNTYMKEFKLEVTLTAKESEAKAVSRR